MDFSKKHLVKAGEFVIEQDDLPTEDDLQKWSRAAKKKVEPWLSALFQSEHLSLLLGSGSTIAATAASNAEAQGMAKVEFDLVLGAKVNEEAARRATKAGRGEPNIEDQLSAALALEEGLRIAGQTKDADDWQEVINETLTQFLSNILQSESALRSAKTSKGIELLASLLLSCASRTSSRERLHILTTNYDRFIEHAADLTGLRLVDRFVGLLEPIFRASRLQIDMHYSPPGIRGEPRLLEGVCHFTKIHGSLDWVASSDSVARLPIAFGASSDHPSVPKSPLGTVMIYPNAAKDRETSGFPFAELFRDMSAAICRPNSTLVTYGYGFGDEHVNRIIADMLTLPSSHLCIISFGQGDATPHDRVQKFVESVARLEQMTLLLGKHFGDLETLVQSYLPRPALDTISFRKAKLEQNRGIPNQVNDATEAAADLTTAGVAE